MKSLRPVTAIVCAALLAGCDTKSAPRSQARPVLFIVAKRELTRSNDFAGTIEPRYRSGLAFRVLGRVIARDVSVGDLVAKGARLAALDPVALDLAVNDARAHLASAAAQFTNAAASEERRRFLFRHNNVAAEQFEAAQQARQAAEAAVTQARSALDKARKQRSYAELRAEFDGVVTAVDMEVGQVVVPGQTVITIARPEVREAVIDVPDEVAAGLHEGSPFEIALQITEAHRVSGRVREMTPQADPVTRTRRVKVMLEDPPEEFRLGTTITAHSRSPENRRTKIPSTALLERDGKGYVWIVNPVEKKVSLREVSVSAREDGAVIVADGLESGENVVVAGVHSLSPGQVVRLAQEARP